MRPDATFARTSLVDGNAYTHVAHRGQHRQHVAGPNLPALLGRVAGGGWRVAQRVAPPGAVDFGEQLGLPPLPASKVVLHTRLSDPRSQETLRAVSSAFLNAAY